ncbi:MAG: NAD(P)-binding domain-containing protein [Rubrivivax sp.]|nr:NAD(P)-binding domain-containing protein [Rubrivivax sp.]
MKIAVIGAGPVGMTLGAGWAAKGHEVRYGARNPASDKVAKALAATPGSTALPIAEAVRWADAALLATPWEGARPAVSGVDFAGKPLLDATNPLTPGFEIAVGHTSSGGEQVQAWAPSASVVKILNSTGAENMANPVYPQGRAAMVYAGGDARAKAVASQLAADLGFEPLDLGGLEGARYLEPAAMVWIRLAIVQRLGRHVAFGLMRR